MPNKPAAGQVHLTLYLPEDLRDRSKAKAHSEGDSLSAVVRRKLEDYVDEPPVEWTDVEMEDK